MERYTYPLNGRSGKIWHVSWKIWKVLGFEPDRMARTQTSFSVEFETPLTTEQETDLDNLMTDATLFDPQLSGFISGTGTNVFVVNDLFMSTEHFQAWIDGMGISGLDAIIFAVESDPIGNPGVYDRMEIHFNKILTNPEKNKVVAAYAAAGDWQA